VIRLQPGVRAPDVHLRTADGGSVATSDLWREGPVVLAFSRHFGCPFCKGTLAGLRREHPRVHEARATVAAVFMGTPRAVDRWCGERDLPFPCYADPDRSAYRSFGLSNGTAWTWIGPRVVGGGVRLFRRGIAAGLPHPGQDVRQLAGTFVIARGGRVRFVHYARDAADVPDIDAILGALGVG